MVPETVNWSGNYRFTAGTMHFPESIDEIRRIVVAAPKIHAIGARHSFNDIADAPEVISLAKLEPDIQIDAETRTVSFNAGLRYVELAIALEAAGWALHNMASLPHVTVAGAVATATHGSGDTSGNLATAVAGLDLVTSEGDLLHFARGDAEFEGAVVGIGALGVVTRLTLDIQPSYLVSQQIFDHLSWEVLYEQFDAVMTGAESVSLFTDFGETVNQVWLKRRVDPAAPGEPEAEFLGAKAAPVPRNPVVEFSADGCTEQLGVPGPWLDRLPHVRVSGVTEKGGHLQTEYMVAREEAVDALRAVRAIYPTLRPHLEISEIRSVAADNLWMSTAYGRDTIGIHLSWKLDIDAAMRMVPHVEAALAPFSPRPHWGKLFLMGGAEIESRFPRIGEFRALAKRLDPRGAFRTAFLERTIF